MAGRNTNFLSVKITERITVNVSDYNGSIYFHVRDNRKEKSVSLAKRDFGALFKKKSELIEAARKISKGRVEKKKMSFSQKKKNSKRESRGSKDTPAAQAREFSDGELSSDAENHNETDSDMTE